MHLHSLQLSYLQVVFIIIKLFIINKLSLIASARQIKDEELNSMRQDITKLKWTNTKFTQKVKTLEDQKNLSTKQLEIQKNEIASLEKGRFVGRAWMKVLQCRNCWQ